MNLYTLHNDTLTVTLDACGAVLHSIVKDGAEYLCRATPDTGRGGTPTCSPTSAA